MADKPAPTFKNKFRDNNGGKGNGNFQRNNQKPNMPGRGGAGGRGQWVMPTGTAFFTGNATAPASTTASNGGSLINRPDATQRIMRPNEAAFYATQATIQQVCMSFMTWCVAPCAYCGTLFVQKPKLDAEGAKAEGETTNALASYYAANAANEDADR